MSMMFPRRARARRTASATALVAGLAAIAPGAAQAASATVQGTVVARNAHRGTLVAAGTDGTVKTLRVTHLGAARLGRHVRAAAVQLADGTYAVSRLRLGGRDRHAQVRATVVRRLASGYLLSAGGSTFSLKARRSAHGRRAHTSSAPATGTINPGDVIVATTTATGGALRTSAVQVTGTSSVLEIQGILVSNGSGQLGVAVEHQGLVTVTVPAGMVVPGNPGDEVELMVSLGSDGSFTLVSAAGDQAASDGQDSGFNVDGESGQVEVHGVLTAVAADSVTVQAGASAPITCAVPADVDVSGFAVGDQVELHCVSASGALTLREMQSDHAQVQAGGHDAGLGDQQDGQDAQDGQAARGDQPDGQDAQDVQDGQDGQPGQGDQAAQSGNDG